MFKYDPNPIPNPAIDVQYEYDADGKQTRLFVTGAGYDYGFGYDALGRFEKITAGVGGTQLFQYQYDLASNQTLRRRNSGTGIAQVDQDYGAPGTSYAPDSLNRMLQRDVKVGSTVISHEAYGYEAQRPGLMTSVTRDYAPNQTQDLFSYDLLPELTNAQYGIPASGPAQRTCGYTFDKAGNRLTMTDDHGPSHNYSITNLNQYSNDGTSGGAITPGSQHEMGNYQSVFYKYVNDTHLSQVSGLDVSGNQSMYQMSYDALGRCAVRILSGVTTSYIYDGEKAILEYNTWSAPTAKNLYGKSIDEILMRIDSTVNNGQPFYYQDDHEGSITHLTNASGTVIESYRYDAFGKPTINGSSSNLSSPYKNRFMFTGREYVEKFGVYEYRNRAYHPGLGRFMSEDPKGFAAGDYNLFRYCHNDPLDMTDPMGLLAGPSSDYARPPKDVAGSVHATMDDDVEITGSHIPASAQNVVNARTLAGLTTAYARSVLSAADGLSMAHAEVSSQESRWRNEVSGRIKFDKDARAAYERFGPTATSVEGLQTGVNETLAKKYGSLKRTGATDSNGNIKISDNPNPYTKEATKRHEAVHRHSALQGQKQYGKGTPEYMRWYLNPQRWGKDEVRAYSAAINYLEAVAANWHSP